MLSFGQVGLIEKNKSGMGILVYSSSIPAPFPLPISISLSLFYPTNTRDTFFSYTFNTLSHSTHLTQAVHGEYTP